MVSVGTDSVLKAARDLRFRRLDGEAVVVRQEAAEVLVFNDLAARLLELADGRTAVGAWLNVLAGEYDVEPAELERDVLAFAAELMREGMLEQVASDAL